MYGTVKTIPYFNRRFLIFCFGVLTTGFSYGQNISIQQFTTSSGLPSSTIYQITEDSQGSIWLATKDGVVKYDGTNFKIYTAYDGLYENEVLGIESLSSNKLILFSYLNKITYWDGFRFSLLESIITDSKLKDELFHSRTNSWFPRFISVGNTCYINKYNVSNTIDKLFMLNENKLEDIHQKLGIPKSHYLLSANKINDNQLYILGIDLTTHKTSIFLVSSNKKAIRLKGDFPLIEISYAHNNKLYLRNKDSIFLYTVDTIQNTLTPVRNPVKIKLEGFSKFICIDSILYIINSFGYSKMYNIDLTHELKDTFYAKLKNISDIHKDNQGNIWISTLSDGLYKLRNSKIKIIEKSNGLVTKSIQSIYAQNSNSILVGDIEGNVHVLKNNKLNSLFKNNVTESKRILNSVRSILPVGENLAILFEKGFRLIDKNYNTLYKNFNPPAYKSISIDSQGNIYFASHISIFKLGNDYKKIEDAKIRSERTTVVFVSKENELWYATLDNLYCYNLDKKTEFSFSKTYPISYTNITKISQTKDGIIWIGTSSRGIVGIINNKILVHIVDTFGLKCSPINCIYPDNNGIWVGTNYGLYKIEYNYLSNKIQNIHLKNFTTASGLSDNFITSISKYEDNIYLGTNKGITILKEDDLAIKHPINAFISFVKINHKDSPIRSIYTLSAFQNMISIGYVGVFYSHLKNLKYAYRILGLNDQWIYTTETIKDIGPLNYGTYIFEVKCIDNQGKAQGKTASVKINILPNYYQTWWFRILICIIILFLIWLYIRHIKNREIENTEVQLQISELEMQAVRSQMNPHFLFNCLNAIQNLVSKKETATAMQYIAKFSHLIRQTLELSKLSSIKLSEEIAYIENYMQLEKLRFQGQLNYEFNCPNNIPYSEIEVPTMFLQPYIENAIRHGIRNLKKINGLINVSFNIKENRLICTIEDNGIGRDEAQRIKSNNVIKYQSRGLELSEKRIHTYNHIYKSDIQVVFNDKKDINDRGLGTIVTITIKINRSI
jgi:anti-sigma regulatory factor (Ser/Thr protein kinase)